MQKFILFAVAFGLFIGIVAPSDKPSPSAATAAQPQSGALFEAPPYKETLLRRKSDGHFYVTADVNGAPITFMIDTGATAVALTEDAARRAGLEFSREEFEPIARTANGIAKGKVVTLSKVGIEGKVVSEVEGAIVEGAEMNLLGQAYLARISGVEMNGETMLLR